MRNIQAVLTMSERLRWEHREGIDDSSGQAHGADISRCEGMQVTTVARSVIKVLSTTHLATEAHTCSLRPAPAGFDPMVPIECLPLNPG